MSIARPILFVTRNYPPSRGGIETLAEELVRYGLSIKEPLVLVHFGQPLCPEPPAGLVSYRHLPGSSRLSALLFASFWIPCLTLKYRPRLILNMQVTTGLGSLIASTLLRIPYIVQCHGLEVLSYGIRPWQALRGKILRSAQRVISNSRYTDSLMAAFKVDPGRRIVINLGTRPFSDTPTHRDRKALFGIGSEKTFVILSLSRLVPRKGFDKTIEALQLVVQERDDFLYCIGGTGPDLSRLKGIVAERGLQKHVRFLGRVADADLGPCYAQSDLFVMPNRFSANPPDVEGFGIVFLEAAACGTPSLGGNSGGVPDAVLDGKTGFLVEPDPAAIAEKILLLMSDRELLKRLGEGAKAHAMELTWEKVCSRYFETILS